MLRPIVKLSASKSGVDNAKYMLDVGLQSITLEKTLQKVKDAR